MQFACCFLGVAPPRPPMKEGLLSRPPGGPYPGRGGMAMHAPRPLLQPSPMAGGCVLMVYGLHEHKMNCDRVFNILCCYGNVLKVWKLAETFKVDMYSYFKKSCSCNPWCVMHGPCFISRGSLWYDMIFRERNRFPPLDGPQKAETK